MELAVPVIAQSLPVVVVVVSSFHWVAYSGRAAEFPQFFHLEIIPTPATLNSDFCSGLMSDTG